MALPQSLIEELARTAPPDAKHNLNRLVIVALEDLVKARRRMMFEESMARMASDPAAQAEIATVQREFLHAEGDGLASTRDLRTGSSRKNKNAARRNLPR